MLDSEMKDAKQKKRFNFTIDSLINPRKDDPSPIMDNWSSTCNPVILRTLSDGYPESSPESKTPNFNDWRADKKVSEYCDTSNLSPGFFPASHISSTWDRNNKKTEQGIGMTPDHVICSSSYSDSSVPPVFITPSPESSPDSTGTNSHYKKKSRTAFTTEQLDQLEKRFQSQRYLATNERTDLADELKLTDQQVKTWFQNRRMKEKRQLKTEQTSSIPFPTGGVDVTQLRALGIPCPLPPGHVTVPSYSSYALPSIDLRQPAQMLSHLGLPFLPPSSQIHSQSIPFLPHYGYQYGFNQLSV